MMKLQKLFKTLMYLYYMLEIYVEQILEAIRKPKDHYLKYRPDLEVKVTEVLGLLNTFKDSYIDSNTIPSLQTPFELQLFNTFRSYIRFRK